MPSKIDPRIRELLVRGVRAAKKVDAVYSIGGALAMRAHGYARHTDDGDRAPRDTNERPKETP